MKFIGECQLYTFIDTAYLHGRTPAELAHQLCEGGSDIIQLRAKTESVEEVEALAKEILPVTRAAGVPLVINDHLLLAQSLGAEFIHLGQEDFFDAGLTHRSQLGPPVFDPAQTSLQPQKAGLETGAPPWLGLSSHAPEQARRAIAAGAEYIAIGPVFATGTKPGRRPVTLDYVRWAAANVSIPWFAIGGVTLQNLDQVLAAGAKRICVVSAILNAPAVATACHEFKRRLCGS